MTSVVVSMLSPMSGRETRARLMRPANTAIAMRYATNRPRVQGGTAHIKLHNPELLNSARNIQY
jgi:hypothetical protein